MPRASSRRSSMAPWSSSATSAEPVAQLGRRAVGGRRLARLLEGDRDGDEPLLRAVVEVAFDPPPLLLGRDREPGPRRPDLLELRLERGVQPLVLDRQAQHRHHRADERRILAQDRVVDDRRERRAVVLQQRHGVLGRPRPGAAAGRPSAAVQPSPSGSGRTRRTSGIAQRGRERRLEADGGGDAPKPDGERDERAAGPAQPERADDEADRDEQAQAEQHPVEDAPATPRAARASGSPVAVEYASRPRRTPPRSSRRCRRRGSATSTWRTTGRLATSRQRQTSATASARPAITALVAVLDGEERRRVGRDRERVRRQAGVRAELGRVLEQQPRGAPDEERARASRSTAIAPARSASAPAARARGPPARRRSSPRTRTRGGSRPGDRVGP